MSQPTYPDAARTPRFCSASPRALERLAPATAEKPDFAAADAFVWHPAAARLAAGRNVNRVDIGLLQGIDRVRDILLENTARFARACRPTTRSSGARAAWASPRWSRPSTPQINRDDAGAHGRSS